MIESAPLVNAGGGSNAAAPRSRGGLRSAPTIEDVLDVARVASSMLLDRAFPSGPFALDRESVQAHWLSQLARYPTPWRSLARSFGHENPLFLRNGNVAYWIAFGVAVTVLLGLSPVAQIEMNGPKLHDVARLALTLAFWAAVAGAGRLCLHLLRGGRVVLGMILPTLLLLSAYSSIGWVVPETTSCPTAAAVGSLAITEACRDEQTALALLSGVLHGLFAVWAMMFAWIGLAIREEALLRSERLPAFAACRLLDAVFVDAELEARRATRPWWVSPRAFRWVIAGAWASTGLYTAAVYLRLGDRYPGAIFTAATLAVLAWRYILPHLVRLWPPKWWVSLVRWMTRPGRGGDPDAAAARHERCAERGAARVQERYAEQRTRRWRRLVALEEVALAFELGLPSMTEAGDRDSDTWLREVRQRHAMEVRRLKRPLQVTNESSEQVFVEGASSFLRRLVSGAWPDAAGYASTGDAESNASWARHILVVGILTVAVVVTGQVNATSEGAARITSLPETPLSVILSVAVPYLAILMLNVVDGTSPARLGAMRYFGSAPTP